MVLTEETLTEFYELAYRQEYPTAIAIVLPGVKKGEGYQISVQYKQLGYRLLEENEYGGTGMKPDEGVILIFVKEEDLFQKE